MKILFYFCVMIESYCVEAEIAANSNNNFMWKESDNVNSICILLLCGDGVSF